PATAIRATRSKTGTAMRERCFKVRSPSAKLNRQRAGTSVFLSFWGGERRMAGIDQNRSVPGRFRSCWIGHAPGPIVVFQDDTSMITLPGAGVLHVLVRGRDRGRH